MNKPNALTVNEYLSNLHSLDDVRQLIAKLGFAYRDEQLPTKSLPDELKSMLADNPRVIANAQGFIVGFIQLKPAKVKDIDRHMISLQRKLISKLPDEYQDASLLVFASDGFENVHFVNAKRVGKRLILRRFLTGGLHKTRTAAERMRELYLEGSESWADILKLVEEAFDRDKVTEQFFKTFESVFKDGKKQLVSQIQDEHAAHQFLHSLLNRLMFIYFVQRKGWLADADTEFIKTLWDKYRDGRDEGTHKPDSFYSDWLATLFFLAFNNKHGYENKGLPKDVVNWFKMAPYLDGGLFVPTEYDEMGFKVSDAMFERIFDDILNAYNFTVTEDTPFDQNIAVDPEMLGIVYESLVNTTELSDERSDAGIFYTPRVEVDFMCRRALVEHLAKRTSATREDLYRFVFPEDGEEQNPEFDKDTREAIDEALVNLTVVDPACGSGAFLVGMMQVIVELRKLLWEQAGKNVASFNDFDDRKKIIERSLYGVDVKDWAIAIAQLRLWLTLIEVADDKKLDLRGMKIANEPLLPKLTFRMRVGDSLVQEIAGTTIPLRSARGKLSPAIQRRVSDLKKLKTDFYFNRGNASRHTIEMKELEVYGAILDEKRKVIKDDIQRLRSASAEGFQQDLLSHLSGEEAKEEAFSEHKEKQEKKRQDTIKELEADLKQLDEIHNSLPKKQRLFWSVEFAEVFQQNGGFDIVIGNPPYVSVERIADPFMIEAGDKPTTEQKKEYKDKLGIMLEDDWGKGGVSLSKRADLYVYFYLRGLALTNENGVFIFITSNSWLDSGFGAGLQEFLLRKTRILAIYDNEAKRSFKNADVNTVIAILEPLSNKAKPDGSHKALFAMFKRPFEEVITSDTLNNIELTDKRASIDSATNSVSLVNVVGVLQEELYRAGCESDEVNSKQNSSVLKLKQTDTYRSNYVGNQWGGRYLRAPISFWMLLDKMSHAGAILGNLVSGERYLNTGGADGFFIFTKFERAGSDTIVWNTSKEGKAEGTPKFVIENRYLRPAVKSTSLNSLLISKTDALVLDVPINEDISASKVKSYIDWGEENAFNTRSVTKTQNPWWKAPKQARQSGSILWMRNHNDAHKVFYNPDCAIAVRFYRFYPNDRDYEKALVAILNSTVVALLKEIAGSTKLGQGALDTTMADMLRMRIPWTAEKQKQDLLASAFDRLSNRKVLPMKEELQKPDRQELDKLVFDLLGLDDNERKLVYEDTLKLISTRLNKARSV